MDAAAAARVVQLDQVLKHPDLAQYQDKKRLRNDVAILLQQRATLHCQQGTFSSGSRSVSLFYLTGVVPITYKGATYNIPVTIYLDPGYPQCAPRCFVTPTAGMALQPNHDRVDQGGMVYHPYLSSWTARSNLSEAVNVMSSIFAEKPPVYSTAAASPPQAKAQPVASAQPPVAKALPVATAQPVQQQPAPSAGSRLQNLAGDLSYALLGSRHPQGLQSKPEQPAQPTATATAMPVAVARPVATPAAQPAPAPPSATPTPAPAPAAPGPILAAADFSNREKLERALGQNASSRWTSVVGPLVDDTRSQSQQKAELQRQAEAVADQMQHLQDATAKNQELVADLWEQEGVLRKFLEEHGSTETEAPEAVESLRRTMTPNMEHVLDFLSEELALEEYVASLDELLAQGKIGIQDFMKEARDASRRQFLCKVNRQKALGLLQPNEATPPPAIVQSAEAAPPQPVTAAAVPQASPVTGMQQPVPVAVVASAAPTPASGAPAGGGAAARVAPRQLVPA